MHSTQDDVIQEEATQGPMVLAYFDGDRPVFRSAASLHEDEAVLEEDAPVSFSGGIPRNVAYEIEDDEPVYRSLGSLALDAQDAHVPAPAPPGLCRQRGFGQPGLCD
mmetsp:Transcript_171/g.470  ORF Transcript_171/g.470 Transcript_171/m.470 type:complete len:107 (+) Transcript_171:101-421(+)